MTSRSDPFGAISSPNDNVRHTYCHLVVTPRASIFLSRNPGLHTAHNPLFPTPNIDSLVPDSSKRAPRANRLTRFALTPWQLPLPSRSPSKKRQR